MRVMVFDAMKPDSLLQVTEGKDVGTLIAD